MARKRSDKPTTAVVRLLCQTTYLVMSAIIRASQAILQVILKDGIRLLFWSIRRYGWGPVSRVAAAAWGSLWLHDQLGWLALSTASVSSVLLGGFTFWSGFHLAPSWLAAGSRWAREAWHRRSERAGTALPVVPGSSLPSDYSLRPVPASAGTSSPLWERILSPEALREAWQRVLARGGGPGSDGVTVEQFALDAERALESLSATLRAGRYRPSAPRWVDIPKPNGGLRRLAVLSVQDRILQHALLSTLTPFWDRRFAPCSYAYRPGRSALQAVAAVEKELAVGRVWVVDADIASFFDTVPHPSLMAVVGQWLAEPPVQALLASCVRACSPEPGRGLAQGAPLSPLLANLYLHRFDTTLLEKRHTLIRYADDLLVLCATRPQAVDALKVVERLLAGLQLRLNQEKTRIVHRDEGFTFLGYTFTREGKRPCEQAMDSLRARLDAADDEATRRQVLAGWSGYFGGGQDSPGADHQQAATSLPTDEPSVTSGTADDTGLQDLASFRRCFLGRADVVAKYWEKNGRKGYAPVRRSCTDDLLRAHLTGEIVLGTYLLAPDSRTRALVFDVDGASTGEKERVAAHQLAQRLVQTLAQRDIAPLLVDSGGKGAHVWMCFKEPIEAKAVRQWADRWLDRFRPFPEGVLIEIFPKQDTVAPGALGSLIRMPLGRHPQTGRWSRLLEQDGTPISNSWPVLAEQPALANNSLPPMDQAAQGFPPPPDSLKEVVEGCALLRSLVTKAASTHHLRHTERLALLYTLGHLGEAGHTYIHQIIALCSNYDPRITDRWLRRLDVGHRPIRCATLHEWLKDYLPGVSCGSCPKTGNPSPLDLRRRGRKSRGRPPASTPSVETDWQQVADDLFGDTCSPEPLE